MKTIAAPAMRSTVVPEPAAWHGPTLAPARYLIPIPAAVLAELDGALAEDGAAGVRLMDEFLGDPAHRLDLWVERGQIQVFRG